LDRLAKGVGANRAIAKCFRAFWCHSFPFAASSSSRSRGQGWQSLNRSEKTEDSEQSSIYSGSEQ
jgi:hypothetical protein